MKTILLLIFSFLVFSLFILTIVFIIKKIFFKKTIELNFKTNEKATPYYCVIDCETTGLLINNRLQATKKNVTENNENFPRIVEFTWCLFSKNKEIIEDGSFLIKQTNKIPIEATKIHKITTEKANKDGIELKEVLLKFEKSIKKCQRIIGHNINFDKKVVEAEFLRCGLEKPFPKYKVYDTMKMGKLVMKQSKNPKLSELTIFLFGRGIEKHLKSHQSLYDVFFTAQCFFKMKSENNIFN